MKIKQNHFILFNHIYRILEHARLKSEDSIQSNCYKIKENKGKTKYRYLIYRTSITDIHTKPGYGPLEGAKISKGTPGVGSSTCEPGSSFDNNSCILPIFYNSTVKVSNII